MVKVQRFLPSTPAALHTPGPYDLSVEPQRGMGSRQSTNAAAAAGSGSMGQGNQTAAGQCGGRMGEVAAAAAAAASVDAFVRHVLEDEEQKASQAKKDLEAQQRQLVEIQSNMKELEARHKQHACELHHLRSKHAAAKRLVAASKPYAEAHTAQLQARKEKAQAQVNMISQQITVLEKELQQLHHACAAFASAYEEHQRKLHDLETAAGLAPGIQSAQVRLMEQAEKALSVKKAQAAQTAKRVSKAQAAARSTSASLKALESELERLHKQDYERETRLLLHQAEAAAAKANAEGAKVKQLQVKVEVLSARVSDLRASVLSLTARVDSSALALARAKQHTTTCKQQLGNLQAQHREAQLELSRLVAAAKHEQPDMDGGARKAAEGDPRKIEVLAGASVSGMEEVAQTEGMGVPRAQQQQSRKRHLHQAQGHSPSPSPSTSRPAKRRGCSSRQMQVNSRKRAVLLSSSSSSSSSSNDGGAISREAGNSTSEGVMGRGRGGSKGRAAQEQSHASDDCGAGGVEERSAEHFKAAFAGTSGPAGVAGSKGGLPVSVRSAGAVGGGDKDGRKGKVGRRMKLTGRSADQAQEVAGRGRSGRQTCQGRGAGVFKGSDRAKAVELQRQSPAAWLEEEGCAVKALEEELAALQASIDTAALEEDLAAQHRLAQLLTLIHNTQTQQAEVEAVRERLVDERFQGLSSALDTINTKLSEVYRFLTGNQGDAYCSYTLERRLLFAHGITLNIRPDQERWRCFAALSGGQQALATLALFFALQAAMPSPFYFFDEVDAALDTMNAARVAEYMASGGSCASLAGTSFCSTPAGAATPPPAPSSLLAPLGHAVPRGQDASIGGICGSRAGAAGAAGDAFRALYSSKADHHHHHHQQQQQAAIGVHNGGAQYIVVSHRPQVFERAACLVGVYSKQGGASSAVVARLSH